MKKIQFDKMGWSLLILLMAFITPCIQSCDDNPDQFELTDGIPEVYYVRVPNPASADSLLVRAFMDNSIVLVGKNLTSIREMWFNAKKALLNSQFYHRQPSLCHHTKEIPEVVTDKTLHDHQRQTTPSLTTSACSTGPVVSCISCEYAHDGDMAILYGDYFIDDPNVPLTITMAGNVPVSEIVSVEKTKITFKIPQGAQKGYLNVKSIYGTGRSRFQFRDDRGMILDWDNLNASGGWRAGKIKNSDPEGITGNYVYFTGTLDGDPTKDWAEDDFSFNLWGTANGRPQGDLFSSDPANSTLKFEVNVTQPWSTLALQMIFTPWATTGTNGYISDGTTPRGLWRPWEMSGSYQTDGWVTVSFPLTDFKYDHTGGTLEMAPKGNYCCLTFFVYHGGITGTSSTPYICIDNIRVVPNE